MNCEYCGRAAWGNDRNCYGCGGPLREAAARHYSDYSGAAYVGTALYTAVSPVAARASTKRYKQNVIGGGSYLSSGGNDIADYMVPISGFSSSDGGFSGGGGDFGGGGATGDW